MPQIPERITKKIQLKTIAGGEVEIYTSLLAADLERISPDPENIKNHPLKTLAFLIKDWNLEDAEGKKLGITEENVGKLDIKEINLIYGEISDFFGIPEGGAGVK